MMVGLHVVKSALSWSAGAHPCSSASWHGQLPQ